MQCVSAHAQVWATADASLCDKCLAPDVVLNQPVLGHVYKGLDKVKYLVENLYKKACHQSNTSAWPRCQHDHVLKSRSRQVTEGTFVSSEHACTARNKFCRDALRPCAATARGFKIEFVALLPAELGAHRAHCSHCCDRRQHCLRLVAQQGQGAPNWSRGTPSLHSELLLSALLRGCCDVMRDYLAREYGLCRRGHASLGSDRLQLAEHIHLDCASCNLQSPCHYAATSRHPETLAC